jgi:hypothetical protein
VDSIIVPPTTLQAYDNGLHPSLIDFVTEHRVDSWGGYRYWLAWTPYLDFTTELPCVAASNDLVNWVLPPGLPNPITRACSNGRGANLRCNDPEICYDPVHDCINLYHGVYNGASLFKDASGVRHDGALFCYHIQANGTVSGRLLEEGAPFTSCSIPGLAGGSVSVHRAASDIWHMWQAGIGYRSSPDGVRWSEPAPCTVGTPDAYHSNQVPMYMAGWVLNHMGGKFNRETGHMEFAVSCVPPGMTGGQGEHLAMLACDISDPCAMYVMLDSWLLTPRTEDGEWDRGSLYRSVLMPHPDGGDKRRLIYSAFSSPCTESLAKPNRISSLVEGDIGKHLLARNLPSG